PHRDHQPFPTRRSSDLKRRHPRPPALRAGLVPQMRGLGELDAINPTAPRRFITLPGRNPGLEPGCDPGPRGFKRCALSLPGSRLFAALRPGSVKWPASCDVLANYFWSCANMKRAALFACLLAFTTPALAQAPSATG